MVKDLKQILPVGTSLYRILGGWNSSETEPLQKWVRAERIFAWGVKQEDSRYTEIVPLILDEYGELEDTEFGSSSNTLYIATAIFLTDQLCFWIDVSNDIDFGSLTNEQHENIISQLRARSIAP